MAEDLAVKIRTMKTPSWFGYIYILKSGDLYKIGQSAKPRKRLRQLRTGSALPIDVVYTMRTPHYKFVEKILHNRLAAKRVQGEWFALSETDLKYITQIDKDGKSPRSHAYNNAFTGAFEAAESDGATRTEAQRLGAIAGAEAMERAALLGCLCDW